MSHSSSRKLDLSLHPIGTIEKEEKIFELNFRSNLCFNVGRELH